MVAGTDKEEEERARELKKKLTLLPLVEVYEL
jgi:hypothetical protein